MSEGETRCPRGHLNPQTNKFCAECGEYIAEVCPNEHPNPRGSLYCGECGVPVVEDFVNEDDPQPIPNGLQLWWAGTPKWGKIAVVAAPVAVLVVVTTMLAVGGKFSGDQVARDRPAEAGLAATDRQDESPATDFRDESPATDRRERVSGTEREWLEAVCEPGGFVDGVKTTSGMFNGSLGGGTCTEPRGGGPDIYLTQWDSGDKMQNRMAQLSMCFVASVDHGNNGLITALSVVPTPGGVYQSLQPLAQFGFAPDC